jgi:hypothetical protein
LGEAGWGPSFIPFPFGFLSAFAGEKLIKITFMQKQVSSRKPRSRYLGCYAIFRSGRFLTFRLFSLPSGQFMHICGSQVFITASHTPPL